MEPGYEFEDPGFDDLPHKPSRGRGGGGGGGAAAAFMDDDMGVDEVEIREQDRYLPVANIARIMKKVLPHNAKITKDSKEAIQECVSEFIAFITQEASDKCKQEKRKTINGDDLLWAMGTLGFEKYIEPLKLFLSKYREASKGDKRAKKNPPPASRPPTATVGQAPWNAGGAGGGGLGG